VRLFVAFAVLGKRLKKSCDDTRTRNFLMTNTANLTSRPPRSVGCNGQKRVVRNRGNFSVLSASFECGVVRFGYFAFSGSLYSHKVCNEFDKTRS
jgi:hypothetical protein